VGAGWIWAKAAGERDNSFLYTADTGVEFQVTKALSITPVVSFTDASSLHVNNKWGYGVKAHYWVTDQWGVSAGIGRDNMVNTTFSVGTTFRF
jgi:predicted 3-demethylubiquinone-9 3-methyltransferase (glyoxalase superfamily)